METTTMGGLISGYSSVFSFSSAKMPKTTSDSITTMVMMGRLMAKLEIHMGDRSLVLFLRRDGGHLHRRTRGHALRGVRQHGVAHGDARGERHPVLLRILRPELHGHLLDHSAGDLEDDREGPGLVDGGGRDHEGVRGDGGDPPLREE